MIVGYGPNEDAKKEEKKKFFRDLQEEVDKTENYVIIIWHLNGRVGKENEKIEWCLGIHREQAKNEIEKE